MRQVLTLPTDLLTVLNEYSDFISNNPPDVNLPNWRTKGKFMKEDRPEFSTSLDCLKSMPHDTHDGFPPDSFGYDMNEPTLKKTLEMEGHRFTPEEKDWIKTYIEKWYIQEAYKRLEEKVIRYSEIIKVSPREMKVRNYKTRWGSCDRKGRLTFNFHLIKAPHSIVDYVVVHELCHMLQPNHSKFFWNEVAKYDPLFKEHKKWLKLNGAELIR